MSVQWWANGERVSMTEAIAEWRRGVRDIHATLPKRYGRPTVYVQLDGDDETKLTMLGGKKCLVITNSEQDYAMAVFDAALRGVEWEREEAAKAAMEEEES